MDQGVVTTIVIATVGWAVFGAGALYRMGQQRKGHDDEVKDFGKQLVAVKETTDELVACTKGIEKIGADVADLKALTADVKGMAQAIIGLGERVARMENRVDQHIDIGHAVGFAVRRTQAHEGDVRPGE